MKKSTLHRQNRMFTQVEEFGLGLKFRLCLTSQVKSDANRLASVMIILQPERLKTFTDKYIK